MQPPPAAPAPEAVHPHPDTILAFLRAHPGFLAANPALYDHLVPPTRLHGATLADHTHAMLARARTRAEAAERAAIDTAATRRDAEGFTRRVQEAVLAMMRAPDPAWLATNELASLLRLDAARICCEHAVLPGITPGIASVPKGTTAAALGHRAALVRPAIPNVLLHGEAAALAAEEALIRVPLRSGPGLLALAARDTIGLAGATTDALAFLGQAVAAALDGQAVAAVLDSQAVAAVLDGQAVGEPQESRPTPP